MRCALMMSALGQKQTFAVQNGMSALHPIADMCGATRYVRYVPEPDMVKRKRPPIDATSKFLRAKLLRLRNKRLACWPNAGDLNNHLSVLCPCVVRSLCGL